MNRNLRAVGLAILILASSGAKAGSPDGLRILVVNSPSAQPHMKAIRDFFERSRASEFECDDRQLNIAEATFGTSGTKIDSTVALAATKQRSARKPLGKMLEAHRDARHPNGFDGVLVVDVSHDVVKLFGISAWTKEKVYTASLRVRDLTTESKVNEAVCLATVQLPVLQAP